MKRAVLALAVLGLGACGTPVDVRPPPSPPPSTTPTAPPTITESVGVEPLMVGDPCALVGADIRAGLDIPSESEPFVDDGERGCRWEESVSGIGLGVLVKPEEDPLAGSYDRPGAEVIEVDGFPAILLAPQPDSVCQIWVKTAPSQGFWVIYGALTQSVDACAGARTVAEYLAGRVRGG